MLDPGRQRQSTEEVAQVVYQGEQLQSYVVVHEVIAGQLGPLDRVLTQRHNLEPCQSELPGWLTGMPEDISEAREGIFLGLGGIEGYFEAPSDMESSPWP